MKPADVSSRPSKEIETVAEILHSVANDHHAWGVFLQLSTECQEDMQSRLASAIQTATAAAYEDAARVAETVRHHLGPEYERPEWFGGTCAAADAIRARASRSEGE